MVAGPTGPQEEDRPDPGPPEGDEPEPQPPPEPEPILVEAATARQADDRRRPGAPTWQEDARLNRRVLVEGGSFLMGSPTGVGNNNEHPQHRVRLSSFFIQEHEVTNEEYRRFDASHTFDPGKERLPATNLYWPKAARYAKWLGGRLPTEAQFEYAAKGGCATDYCLAEGEPATLDELAWHRDNSGRRLWPVAQKEANQRGLFDIYGNTWEWTHDSARGYGTGEAVDPIGPEGSFLLRGGAYDSNPETVRSTYRFSFIVLYAANNVGFRVAWPAAEVPE